jgi:hypothetical protein
MYFYINGIKTKINIPNNFMNQFTNQIGKQVSKQVKNNNSPINYTRLLGAIVIAILLTLLIYKYIVS